MIESLSADWLLSPGEAPLWRGEAGIDKDQGKIIYISSENNERESHYEGTTFLTPGLINAHTHLELYSDKPIPPSESIGRVDIWVHEDADSRKEQRRQGVYTEINDAAEQRIDEEDAPQGPNCQHALADWILKVIEHSRAMTPEDKRQACRKSIKELLNSGTTCVNDVSSDGTSLDIMAEAGMRGVVSLEFFYPFHTDKPDLTLILDKFRTLKEQLRDKLLDNSLLSIGISPHSPYNVTSKAWGEILDALDSPLVHTHLAETRAEIDWFKTGSSPLDKVHQTVLGRKFGPETVGVSPVENLKSLLSSNWVAAHGIYLTDNDISLLKQSGVSLAHCPRSNLWLSGETISDYKKLISSGITVGVGTDSRLSSPDLDLREEGRTLCRLHGVSAREAFERITAGSAEAIKMGDRLGRIRPEFMADLVLWWNPARIIDDPYKAWLAPETVVKRVWINGSCRTGS